MSPKATITIRMSNAAFYEDDHSAPAQGQELARILRKLADSVEDCQEPNGATLHDSNGNRVGEMEVWGNA